MTKENQAELEIEALEDVFGISTIGFKEFYKNAKESATGYYSKAASSGNYSTAASSGYYSKAASSGYYSKAASSGNYSTAASSGDYSTAASYGNSSKAASSGDYSTAASSGDYSACAAVGYRAAVKGDIGNLIMASEYIKKDTAFIPIGGKADLIDGKILKPNCWYIVENEKWVEVDFSDGVFSYVLSSKKGIKKVKTEDDRIMFIASDENGISAHGKSKKEATEELLFKTGKRDISEYKNMPLTAVKTPSE